MCGDLMKREDRLVQGGFPTQDATISDHLWGLRQTPYPCLPTCLMSKRRVQHMSAQAGSMITGKSDTAAVTPGNFTRNRVP